MNNKYIVVTTKRLHLYNSPPNQIAIYKGDKITVNSDRKLESFNNDPALITTSGILYWFKNGRIHRNDGPAIIFPDGSYRWAIDGLFFSNKKLFQTYSKNTDEDMTALLLKYDFDETLY
jgi:hypothetical protein